MNFKGKRFCQAAESLRGSLNFLHKQMFRHCSLLCMLPVSLAPTFIIILFVWLFFWLCFWFGFCLFKSFNFGSKESFTKACKAGTSLKTMWWSRGLMQCWMPEKPFPPSPNPSCDCFILSYVLLCEGLKGKSRKRVKIQKQLGKLCAPHSTPKPLRYIPILVLLYKGQLLHDTLLPTHHPGM